MTSVRFACWRLLIVGALAAMLVPLDSTDEPLRVLMGTLVVVAAYRLYVAMRRE